MFIIRYAHCGAATPSKSDGDASNRPVPDQSYEFTRPPACMRVKPWTDSPRLAAGCVACMPRANLRLEQLAGRLCGDSCRTCVTTVTWHVRSHISCSDTLAKPMMSIGLGFFSCALHMNVRAW